jgi:hypothetical protein
VRHRLFVLRKSFEQEPKRLGQRGIGQVAPFLAQPSPDQIQRFVYSCWHRTTRSSGPEVLTLDLDMGWNRACHGCVVALDEARLIYPQRAPADHVPSLADRIPARSLSDASKAASSTLSFK